MLAPFISRVMKATSTFNSWVNCPQPNPQASLRLFCFPYAGGGTHQFRTWAESLPQTVEVCPVELPGRGTQMRSAPLTRLETLVQAIAPTLIPHLDKPFAFFGHSLGGLVCFELARLLRREYALHPVHLFVSASCAPQVANSDPPIHALPEPEFLEELRRLNGTPASVLENAELMQILLPVLRADFALLETYVYTNEPLLECPIAAFGGWQDREVSREELEAWREQTTASFSLKMLPGDHFFIHSAQPLLLYSLAQQLQAIETIHNS